MKLNENSRKYRENIEERERDYEDYARNGGCIALMFAAVLVITMMLASVIFTIVGV